MGWLGAWLGGPPGYVAASISNAATAESIRDRVLTLVEAIVPDSLSGNRFLRLRNEEAGDKTEWCEKNPGSCLRRVWCREVGSDEPPEVSNTTEERVRLRLELRVAYPQTQRFGKNAALDRDDVINQDWKRINFAIGIYGRGNFSGTNDCTPLGATREMERGNGVDYMVVTADYMFVRSTT